jgi:hypothetical protein
VQPSSLEKKDVVVGGDKWERQVGESIFRSLVSNNWLGLEYIYK